MSPISVPREAMTLGIGMNRVHLVRLGFFLGSLFFQRPRRGGPSVAT